MLVFVAKLLLVVRCRNFARNVVLNQNLTSSVDRLDLFFGMSFGKGVQSIIGSDIFS